MKGTKWKFNPPIAHGSVWEQLGRSFLLTLYAILGNRRRNGELLPTTFCTVEESLNARPLVPASADPMEKDTLTPNHFLLRFAGSSSPSLANCDSDHRRHYAQVHAYSDATWSRWLKEYVPSLNSRTKWPSPSNRELQTGNFVWILEPTSPRGYCSLARVVKLNFRSDAVACSAEVRTAFGNLIRPVVNLAPVFPVSVSE